MTAQFLISLIVIVVLVPLILLSCAYLILLERKVASWVQDRIGPNRTNFSFGILPLKGFWFGLGQPMADGLKLFIKEDYTPPGVDRKLFLLAPILVAVPAMVGWAVIPWGGFFQFPGFELPQWLPLIGGFIFEPSTVAVTVAPVNIGIIYILAVGSLAVYGVILAGFASNDKYSFLGSLRATGQMLSYEIPQALCVLIIILTSGAVLADWIALNQSGVTWFFNVVPVPNWNIIQQPLLAAIFFVCILAECNRAPFDLAETEQELVGGFHTEYASMKWALFFLGEYMHMITGCAFFVLLFLGGWDIPWVPQAASGGIGLVIVKAGVFVAKVGFMLFVMMWVRWTLPRFRYDQLMRLAWYGMIPVTLIILLGCSAVVFMKLSPWWHFVVNAGAVVVMLAVGPLLPKGPAVNRRIPLEGSRFSPLAGK